MKKHQAAVIVWLIVAALMPAVVSAQSGNAPPPPEVRRPYRGLFSGLSTARTPQSLVLSGSLYGAYDDNVLAGLNESNNSANWHLQNSGVYLGGAVGLDYAISRSSQRVDFGAQAGGQLRYYRHEDLSSLVPDYRASADVGFRLGRSTRLRLGHQFVYSSQYRLFGVTAEFDDEEIVTGDLIVSDPALDLFRLDSVRNTSRVSLNHSIGRHTSFTVGYAFRSVDFVEDEGDPEDEGFPVDDGIREGHLGDYSVHSGQARLQYTRPLTAYASLNLGYGIRVSESRVGTGEPRVLHDIRAGISYSRALSFSRRTSLSFSTGSAITVNDDLQQPEVDTRTDFRLTGDVELLHEMGRTWTARVGYFRGFVFREAFAEPYFTDGVHAGLGGLITRRLSFSAVATWNLSQLQRRGQTGHRGMIATAQSTYALNSFLALFADYVYYEYKFQEDVPLDPRFPRLLDRQGVRVGITTSIPLIH